MRTPVCPIADVPVVTQPEVRTVGDGEPRPAGGGRLDYGLRIASCAHHRRPPVEIRANPLMVDQMLVVAALLARFPRVLSAWRRLPHHCNESTGSE